MVYNLSVRNSKGHFIKKHKVPKAWRESSSKKKKGKRCSPKTEFKKGHRVSAGTEFKKGNIPWNKGLKGFMARDQSGMWKGDGVGLSGLHKWVYLVLGQPNTCEHCGKTGLKGHKIHWASKDHKYKRNVKDWLRLCVLCHKKHDKSHIV